MFVLIWSAWAGQTYYCSRFDTGSALHKMTTVVQCFIAAVMAANAKDALDSRASAGFGAAYAGLRFILAVEYLQARTIGTAKTLASRYAAAYGSVALIWVISALTPAPARFWLWAGGFALDFATPFLARREALRIPPHHEHLPERFSLFFVIVLGEFVADVMRGIEAQEFWSLTAASTAIGGTILAFVLTRLRLRPTRCIHRSRCNVFGERVFVTGRNARKGHLRFPSLASLSSLSAADGSGVRSPRRFRLRLISFRARCRPFAIIPFWLRLN